MPRQLSAALMQALNAQETGEVLLHLLTIDHDDLPETLRFVDNTVDITSGGNVYTAVAFQLALPQEREDAMPQVQVRIDNVDRRIMESIRPLVSPPAMTLAVILASSPNTMEFGPCNFTLRGVEYDARSITGVLAHEDVLNEPAMQYAFTPQNFPGLFP